MGIDIRLPIGVLFLAIGLVLGGAGLAGGQRTLAGALPAVDIDLIWGAALAGFGLVMLALAGLARRKR